MLEWTKHTWVQGTEISHYSYNAKYKGMKMELQVRVPSQYNPDEMVFYIQLPNLETYEFSKQIENILEWKLDENKINGYVTTNS